jgi:hypothetical protein
MSISGNFEYIESVVKKLMSEYNNKYEFLNSLSKDVSVSKWLDLLNSTALSYETSICENTEMPGLIQDIRSHKSLCIILYTKHQLDCIKNTTKFN